MLGGSAIGTSDLNKHSDAFPHLGTGGGQGGVGVLIVIALILNVLFQN